MSETTERLQYVLLSSSGHICTLVSHKITDQDFNCGDFRLGESPSNPRSIQEHRVKGPTKKGKRLFYCDVYDMDPLLTGRSESDSGIIAQAVTKDATEILWLQKLFPGPPRPH